MLNRVMRGIIYEIYINLSEYTFLERLIEITDGIKIESDYKRISIKNESMQRYSVISAVRHLEVAGNIGGPVIFSPPDALRNFHSTRESSRGSGHPASRSKIVLISLK